jgi:hypothetical protein
MEKLRSSLAADGKLAGVRILKTAHFFGFLEPSSWQIPTAKKAKT